MIKKVFLQTQFGTPHSWTNEYIEHLKSLEKYGWYWITFTPNQIPQTVNHIVIPMTLQEFDDLIYKKLGIRVGNYLDNGVPHRFISDFYVAFGKIFEDYIKEYDYWGHTNWDIVYGRLDKFLPDSELEKWDVWTDNVNSINGIFTLYRNREDINNLFKEIPDWETILIRHRLFGTDEYHMTEVMKKAELEGKVKYGHPQHYALHSYDRLEQHVPDVKLRMLEDGSLYELFKDTAPPNWLHATPFPGREIAYFHFIRTKKWPKMS